MAKDDLIQRLLAGPIDVELDGRERARLEAYLTSPWNRPSLGDYLDGNPEYDKLKQIRDFNRRLAKAVAPDEGPAADQRRKPPKKVDAAIAIKMQHPEWSEADVARAVPCAPSLLSRSKRYQGNATTIEQAYSRLPGNGLAAYDARTGECHPIGDDS